MLKDDRYVHSNMVFNWYLCHVITSHIFYLIRKQRKSSKLQNFRKRIKNNNQNNICTEYKYLNINISYNTGLMGCTRHSFWFIIITTTLISIVFKLRLNCSQTFKYIQTIMIFALILLFSVLSKRNNLLSLMHHKYKKWSQSHTNNVLNTNIQLKNKTDNSTKWLMQTVKNRYSPNI